MEDYERDTKITQLVTGFNTARNRRIATETGAVLRVASQDGTEQQRKSARVASQDGTEQQRTYLKKVRDEVWSLKVPSLRSKLSAIGLNDRGKKAELCSRLIEHRAAKLSSIGQADNHWVNDELDITKDLVCVSNEESESASAHEHKRRENDDENLLSKDGSEDESEDDNEDGDWRAEYDHEEDAHERHGASWSPEPTVGRVSPPIGLKLDSNFFNARNTASENISTSVKKELQRIAEQCDKSHKNSLLRDELILTLLEAVERLFERINPNSRTATCRTSESQRSTDGNCGTAGGKPLPEPAAEDGLEWKTITSKPTKQPLLTQATTSATTSTPTNRNRYETLRTGVNRNRQMGHHMSERAGNHDKPTARSSTSANPTNPATYTVTSSKAARSHDSASHQPESKKRQSRPQVVINNKPDANQRLKTVPGNSSFADTVKNGEKVALLSDSMCSRMSKYELKKKLGNISKKAFPGATTDDLHKHYMWPTLNKNTPDVAIIHVGVNNILARGTSDGGATANVIEDIAKDIIKCGEACTSAGVNTVCISGVLPFKGRRAHATTNHINHQVAKLCMEHQYDFILHDNIRHDKNDPEALYYSDGLHLSDKGQDILIDNFKHYLDQRASK
jgi:lysophospholipase L1-like esterase